MRMARVTIESVYFYMPAVDVPEFLSLMQRYRTIEGSWVAVPKIKEIEPTIEYCDPTDTSELSEREKALQKDVDQKRTLWLEEREKVSKLEAQIHNLMSNTEGGENA